MFICQEMLNVKKCPELLHIQIYTFLLWGKKTKIQSSH